MAQQVDGSRCDARPKSAFSRAVVSLYMYIYRDEIEPSSPVFLTNCMYLSIQADNMQVKTEDLKLHLVFYFSVSDFNDRVSWRHSA